MAKRSTKIVKGSTGHYIGHVTRDLGNGLHVSVGTTLGGRKRFTQAELKAALASAAAHFGI